MNTLVNRKKLVSPWLISMITAIAILLGLPNSALAASFLHFGHYGHHFSLYRHYSHYAYPYSYGRYSYPYAYYPRHHRADRYAYRKRDNYSNGSGNNYGDGTGWSLQAQGRAVEAASAFSSEAQRNSSAGMPKVGYALAKAATGDHQTAMWAMRRAFRIDPASLHELNVDAKLQADIRKLINTYEYQQHKNSDAAFMTAALAFLIHDYAAASQALGHARRVGDRSVSTKNLEGLITRYGIAASGAGSTVNAYVSHDDPLTTGSLQNRQSDDPSGPALGTGVK